MNTTLYQNRPGETLNWTNLLLEPHNYQIYYVNVDIRHQYGISLADSQAFGSSRNVPSSKEGEETAVFAG